jgi:hypothetical protein
MLKKRVKKGGRGRKEAVQTNGPSSAAAAGTITDELRSQLIAHNTNAYAGQASQEGEESSNVLIVGAKKKKEKVIYSIYHLIIAIICIFNLAIFCPI